MDGNFTLNLVMIYENGQFFKDTHERSFKYSRGRIVIVSVPYRVTFFNASMTVTVPFFTLTVRSVSVLKH